MRHDGRRFDAENQVVLSLQVVFIGCFIDFSITFCGGNLAASFAIVTTETCMGT